MLDFVYLFFGLLALMLLSAGLLHLLPRIGMGAITTAAAKAPLLDLLIFHFTVLPWVAGIIVGQMLREQWWGGWLGCIVAVAAQVASVLIWSWAHEMAHREASRGPGIFKTMGSKVGRVRNFVAVWCTAIAVPLFAIVRLAELIIYPPLTVLVRLPKYRAGDWVNVSRHKFNGLVGTDRIWCLYCDWMTGVWSLGTEMLRNVESFWCPIRFNSPEKCENCRIDFPDIDAGWTPADGTMTDVVATLTKHYPGPGNVNSWFGHPARLTVNGEAVDN